MIDTIYDLLRKHRELVSYGFWGVMTTIVNYLTYFLLRSGLHIHLLASNVIAWAVSVQVALRELWQMVASRLFSLGLETGILWFFVEQIHCNETVVKLAANILVIAVNYVLSKYVIFKKKAD